ncbi:MAG: alpha/beta hydrolase [Acidimicrobiales bacterium]|nr:alpha/beta hydrolase [Acidimicrobiales bacterium]HJO79796.1 alpha/beta hydrolase [Acidimicrobiales bacterium]
MPLTGFACGHDNYPVGAPATTLITAKAPAEPPPDPLAALSRETELDKGQTDNGQLFHLSYGAGPLQTGSLRLPPGNGAFPVVIFFHGGFWRSGFDRSLMTPLAEDAVARGVATWNIDYRSVGDPGGGYPGTLNDIAHAVDFLAQIDMPLRLEDVMVIGHSAGGHLALWAASRNQLESGDPGAHPVIEPHTVVAQAAVVDLAVAAEANLGWGAVQAFLGGEPSEVPEHYRVAQPTSGSHRTIAVHGRYDQVVPISQSGLLSEAVGIFSDTGTHFDVLNPNHDLWLRTMAELGLKKSMG